MRMPWRPCDDDDEISYTAAQHCADMLSAGKHVIKLFQF